MIFIMGTKFLIRQADVEDAQAIAQVSFITWPHTYRGILPDEKIDSRNLGSVTETWNQILNQNLSKSVTIVAIRGESIIAYSRFYPSVDIDDEPARVATIGSIYVLPSFQRQGVGRELMEAILKVAKAQLFEELTLHVLAANERARRFYAELDWTQDVNPNIENSEGDLTPKVRYRMKQL